MNNTTTLQDKQNEWSLYRVSSTGSKVRITPIVSTLQDKQNEWSIYRVKSTGSKVRMNNNKHFYSSRKTK